MAINTYQDQVPRFRALASDGLGLEIAGVADQSNIPFIGYDLLTEHIVWDANLVSRFWSGTMTIVEQ